MNLKNAVAVWIGLIVFALTPAASQQRQGLPLFFVPNRGQAPAPVRYLLRSAELSAYFTAAETRLDLQGEMLAIRFAGASAAPRLEALELLPGKVNYLMGNREENWHTGLPAYGALAYRGLYPGVDLVYGAAEGRLKSEFHLAPGADPGLIRWFYDGASAPRGDGQGGLIVSTPGGELRERKPALHQEIGGRSVPVVGSFRFFADGSVGFETEAYDRGLPLVIDPILSYSTYLGGGGLDSANAIAVDSAGNAYVAGHTDSVDFPTANPLRSRGGGVDAFVAKLNPAGNSLIYCTYFGGSGDDRAFGVTADGSENAYLTGWTYSANFPVTSGSRQPVLGGGRDAFVAKLNPSGGALLYSTYLGGSGHDSGNAIAADAAGNAYIAGDSYSTNLPVMNALQGSNSGRQDAFVAKLNAAGSSLVWSTYLGGYGDDRAAALALDLAGNVYLTGGTTSANYPTYRAIQAVNGGGQDGFVSGLAADGLALLFSTYLGGSGGTTGAGEAATGIALDAAANIYVAGYTSSKNFPTVNPLQAAHGGGVADAFIAKLNPSGGALLYSTYLGGAGVDYAYAVAVTTAGAAAVAGYTLSSNFPVAGALQPAKSGGYDAFFARLIPAGSALETATYWGGSDSDSANALAMDRNGNTWIAGQTQSLNFPLKSAIQPLNAGGASAFVAKFREPTPVAVFRAGNGNTLLTSYGSTNLANALGNITTDPGITQNSAGDTYAVGLNATTRVYLNIFRADTQSWSGWLYVGDQKYGNPAVAATATGEAWVVARDASYNYYINHYRSSGAFDGWVSLGGGFASEPSIALARDGSIYLAGRKASGVVYGGRYVPGSGFQGWVAASSGVLAAGKPALAAGADGAVYVAIKATDNGLWMARIQGDVWGSWYSGGGQLGRDPDLAAAGGTIYAAVTSSGNSVYVRPYLEGIGSGWQGWILPGGTLERVAVAATGGRYFLAGRTLANWLWWYESGVGWTNLGYPGVAGGNLTVGPK